LIFATNLNDIFVSDYVIVLCPVELGLKFADNSFELLYNLSDTEPAAVEQNPPISNGNVIGRVDCVQTNVKQVAPVIRPQTSSRSLLLPLAAVRANPVTG